MMPLCVYVSSVSFSAMSCPRGGVRECVGRRLVSGGLVSGWSGHVDRWLSLVRSIIITHIRLRLTTPLIPHPQRTANSPSSNMLTLCCWILGTTHTFPIDIDPRKLVGHLQKAILVENPNNFRGIDACQLILWKAKCHGAIGSSRGDNLGGTTGTQCKDCGSQARYTEC